MKHEENLKYWKQILKFFFFQYLKKSYKIQTTFHQYKNYTAHPHDMVHVPAKFREN